MPAWADFYHNYQVTFLQSKPTTLRLGLMTADEFAETYQQMLIDINKSDFCDMMIFASVIATKPV